MARGEKDIREYHLPAWWGTVSIILGVACLIGCALLVLAEGESSASDRRTASRGIIVGVTLISVGLFSVVDHRRSRVSAPADSTTPPQPTAAVPERTTPAQRGTADLEGMLQHSDDVLATLRDLVLHGKDKTGLVELAELLSRSGLLEWEDAPTVRANRLRRNGRWWLSVPGIELKDRELDLLVTIEAALNIGEDLASRPASGELDSRVARALEVRALRPLQGHNGRLDELLLTGGEKDGEWAARVRLANNSENLPAPFRVELDYQVNTRLGIACLEAVVPRPSCFSFASPSPARRAELAITYALELSLALAQLAFDASSRIRRVVINGHERGNAGVVLSLDLSRDSLTSLMGLRDREVLVRREDVHLCRREDGWLTPVEPFERYDSRTLCPTERFQEVELNHAPCPDALRSACGSRLVSDLGIMEKAGRAHAWNQAVGELGCTTQDAVSRLMALRDASDDVTVVEACERACRALVEGTVDVSDRRSLAALFVDGGSLGDATRRARHVFDGEPTPSQLEEALQDLEGVLSPITEMGIYLDDEKCVYRYFNSVAERIAYNREADDGKRAVRLVPDEYYAAHSLSARILSMLGRNDEALAHADELMRIAPVTPDAVLGKVRCLEEQSRIFESADLLKEAIGFSSTARDMSICFYRLAYMEWKLGRNDLAIACYQRSISLHPEMAANAQGELNDLLAANEDLEPLRESEVVPTLEAGGLPVGDLDRIRSMTEEALIACTDAELFNVARPLASVLIEIDRDDALIDVRRSLMRP